MNATTPRSHGPTRLIYRALFGLLASLLIFQSLASGGAVAMPAPAAGSNPSSSFQGLPTETPTPTTTATATPVPGGSANQCAGNGSENAPDAYEPADDNRTGATTLEVNIAQRHTLCSTTSLRDVDWLRLTALSDSSRTYTVRTYDLSSGIDTLLTAEGPDFFNTDDDGNSGESSGASRTTFTLSPGQTALISVTQSGKTPFSLGTTNQPRAYTIVVTTSIATATPTVTPTLSPTPTLTVTPTPSFCRDDYEWDNRRDAANPLYVNQPQRRFLCGDGDIDWVWFDAVANKPYRLLTSDLAQGVDTFIGLYDAEGRLLHFNDDYPNQGLASRIDFTSPVTTRYWLKVQDAAGHGDERFSYTLQLQSDGNAVGGPCLDSHEDDGLPATAKEILLGETQAHTFCPEGDADWLRFFAGAGKSYTLATSNLGVGTDTLIIIFGPDLVTIVGQDDDSGGNLASRVDFVPAVSGTHYAQIKNAGDIGGRGQRYTVGFGPAGAVPTPRATTVNRTPTTITPTATTISGTPNTRLAEPPLLIGPPVPSAEARPSQAALAPPSTTVNLAPGEFADPAFAATWQRTDAPLRQHLVERSWLWGEMPGPSFQEPYKGAPGGSRLVQYFDKARLEITNPTANRAEPWFVTNGLLVRELIAGAIQVGDVASEPIGAARLPIAGDAGGAAPTYASLARVASLDDDRRVPERIGRPVIETLSSAGKIAEQPSLGHHAVNVRYVRETGHNIPDLFWRFMHQQGPVMTASGLVEEQLVDPLVAFGYPLTEAYWTRATINGTVTDVLVQAFERRILTYTPGNQLAWQVEMGNVGQHYRHWRYAGSTGSP